MQWNQKSHEIALLYLFVVQFKIECIKLEDIIDRESTFDLKKNVCPFVKRSRTIFPYYVMHNPFKIEQFSKVFA